MQYTENYSMNKPQFGENALVTKLNENADTLDTLIYNTRQMQADTYDSTQTYNTGDLVSYNSALYICLADNTTGAWDNTKWSATTLAEQIELAKQSGGESALADLEDVEITNPSTGQALLFDDDDDKWKNQDLPDVSVTKTATGNPIELTDAASAPLVKCTTAITGSQDLHGYDKPWVGGAGKNLVDWKASFNSQLVKSFDTSGYYTVSGESTFLPGAWYIKVKKSDETYYDKSELGYYISQWTTAGSDPKLYVSNTNIQYFSVLCPNDGDTIYLRKYDADGTISVQIEKGSTATTYAPYSNICPITAYDESTISVEDENEVVQQTSTATFTNSIYQGDVDFVNGTAEIVKLCYLLSDFTWHYVAQQQRFYTTGVPFKASAARKGWVLSSAYEAITDGRAVENIPDCSIYTSGQSTGTLYIQDSRYSDPTDLVTNMGNTQICYELATPTTEDITPTNLPIKSLFGYNHIESSTGDMEIEYITENYQPLVDLIQSSNGHTYSTQEQVVGKWIDGKTLYEKTYKFTGTFYGSTNIGSIDVSNVDYLFVSELSGHSLDDSWRSLSFAHSDAQNNVGVFISGSGDVSMRAGSSVTSQYAYDIVTMTVRYTKPTQTRSLNTSLTSQKAQIEPLTDKTEEVPTEEEKAVNEEENTNER